MSSATVPFHCLNWRRSVFLNLHPKTYSLDQCSEAQLTGLVYLELFRMGTLMSMWKSGSSHSQHRTCTYLERSQHLWFRGSLYSHALSSHQSNCVHAAVCASLRGSEISNEIGFLPRQMFWMCTRLDRKTSACSHEHIFLITVIVPVSMNLKLMQSLFRCRWPANVNVS